MKTATNGMGRWKAKDPKYSGKKHRHEPSRLGRRRVLSPPKGGWPANTEPFKGGSTPK